jgi:geranylgeranyl transferase type-1 subunit beta
VLKSLDEANLDREKLIKFIYALQCSPKPNSTEKDADIHFGFLGSPYLGFTCDSNQDEKLADNIYFTGNLVYTFPALCSLLMLGDDLSKVNKKGISKWLSLLQLSSGR